MANTLVQAEVEGGFVSEDDRRLAEHDRTVRERQKQALNLQRQSILSQHCSNPMRRAALENALAQIDAQIQAMN
ncbi:MAG: hypothetical protein ABR924_03080 [Terracidiphilus sp.]|jgi:multidrug efflux pump subunit AcrA (membrane-fusion protein)